MLAICNSSHDIYAAWKEMLQESLDHNTDAQHMRCVCVHMANTYANSTFSKFAELGPAACRL